MNERVSIAEISLGRNAKFISARIFDWNLKVNAKVEHGRKIFEERGGERGEREERAGWFGENSGEMGEITR